MLCLIDAAAQILQLGKCARATSGLAGAWMGWQGVSIGGGAKQQRAPSWIALIDGALSNTVVVRAVGHKLIDWDEYKGEYNYTNYYK